MNKKKLFATLFVLSGLAIVGCTKTETNKTVVTKTILNGGFETADLSGWTVLYGDAYSDDSVSSKSTFTLPKDKLHQAISIGKEGNWFLSGKGYDNSFSNARTGAIRSRNFTLLGDGTISFKLAGGAQVKGRGDNPAQKREEQLCYLGVYTAKDDKMIARQINEYFVENSEEYVIVKDYEMGVCHTDNFVEYELDLRKYKNEELYIKIVDPDTDVYYGYLSVDDIRIGGEDSQEEGAYFIKDRYYETEAEAASQYEIANPGFETGSLAGWTIESGLAFSNSGVNQEKTWWNENITYSRDGNYHYGFYNPSATGKMRSSAFTLGGSGYVTFKLGGCSNNSLTYISFVVINSDNSLSEVARFSNSKFTDFQFPFVENGLRFINLVQYVADLREYIGQEMFIEVVDNNTSNEDQTAMVLDSFNTYHETKPELYDKLWFEAVNMINVEKEPVSEYQVLNGTFETGDLTGWTLSNPDNPIGTISDADGWWYENLPYNKNGRYLFTGIAHESNTGTLTSSTFKVGGINKMSFRLGGGGNPRECYVSIKEADTNIELARYANRYFHDIGIELINHGSNLANMNQYVADLSAFEGKEIYIQVTDNATSGWGLITCDSFITYHVSESSLPEGAYEARDILPQAILGEADPYQVLNGNFETGDMTGWTKSGDIAGLASNEVWWNEWYSYEKEGTYFLSGWAGDERNTGTITSSSFTVGGINKISFRLGGGKNGSLCRVEIIDAASEEILKTYTNYMFNDHMVKRYFFTGSENVLSNDGIYMANMVTYIADITDLNNREVKIRIVDEALNDWGLIFADAFITHYESESELPQGYIAGGANSL